MVISITRSADANFGNKWIIILETTNQKKIIISTGSGGLVPKVENCNSSGIFCDRGSSPPEVSFHEVRLSRTFPYLRLWDTQVGTEPVPIYRQSYYPLSACANVFYWRRRVKIEKQIYVFRIDFLYFVIDNYVWWIRVISIYPAIIAIYTLNRPMIWRSASCYNIDVQHECDLEKLKLWFWFCRRCCCYQLVRCVDLSQMTISKLFDSSIGFAPFWILKLNVMVIGTHVFPWSCVPSLAPPSVYRLEFPPY